LGLSVSVSLLREVSVGRLLVLLLQLLLLLLKQGLVVLLETLTRCVLVTRLVVRLDLLIVVLSLLVESLLINASRGRLRLLYYRRGGRLLLRLRLLNTLLVVLLRKRLLSLTLTVLAVLLLLLLLLLLLGWVISQSGTIDRLLGSRCGLRSGLSDLRYDLSRLSWGSRLRDRLLLLGDSSGLRDGRSNRGLLLRSRLDLLRRSLLCRF
jgi:hypothetical protein